MSPAILGILAALVGTSPPPPSCSYNRAEMLNMDLDTFDQSDKGWRSLLGEGDCDDSAVGLIKDYLTAHPDLSADQRPQLLWHEGQLLAGSNHYDESLVVFRSIHETEESMRLYQAATIAFLQRDKTALLAARAALAALPEPPDFEAAAKIFREKTGETLAWPENLNVVDGLIRCFSSSYRVAYGDKCPR
jgi:hypothetical protein